MGLVIIILRKPLNKVMERAKIILSGGCLFQDIPRGWKVCYWLFLHINFSWSQTNEISYLMYLN